ncbi:hypothetical protein ACFVY1_48380 [Streptomyces sp. NPDC058293]|uniref:hypothetical protein n=1 Tax=Streptomyces sp. NPDC058293 TaxID=3346429 RepID=UPI0036E29339
MIAKSFPHIRGIDTRSALAELPELRQLAARAEEFGPLVELAERLDALVRSYARHPCGVILSNASLLGRLPVQRHRAASTRWSRQTRRTSRTSACSSSMCRGVRMQSAMAHAVHEIRRTTGRHLDLDNPDHVPFDDPATFEMIRRSDTLGCLQIDSVSSSGVLPLA